MLPTKNGHYITPTRQIFILSFIVNSKLVSMFINICLPWNRTSTTFHSTSIIFVGKFCPCPVSKPQPPRPVQWTPGLITEPFSMADVLYGFRSSEKKKERFLHFPYTYFELSSIKTLINNFKKYFIPIEI